MTSPPNYKYLVQADLGSKESNISNFRYKIKKFIITFLITFQFVLIGILSYLLLQSNISFPNLSQNTNKNEASNSDSNSNLINNDNDQLVTTTLLQNENYRIFTTIDPVTYDLKVFAQSIELVPKTLELFNIYGFSGKLVGAIASRNDSLISNFILKVKYGNDTKFYLMGLSMDEDQKNLIPNTTQELSFDLSSLETNIFEYEYDFLTFVDDQRVLIEQSEILKYNPIDITKTYWVAPVNDINLKSYIEI